MKVSKYNFFYKGDSDSEWVLFNSRTGALSQIEQEYYDALQNLEKKGIPIQDEEQCKQLKVNGYILDDDVDELALVRYAFNKDKYDSTSLSLTIAPTMQCNFGCVYCFEKNSDHGSRMNVEVSEKIIDFIQRKASTTSSLHITWFGGEPLLHVDIIYSLSQKINEICEENKISYSANVVTNGYFLTKEVAQKLVESKVDYVQITLDGPQDIHDTRRPLLGGQGTYKAIMENVIACADIIPIVVRINVDVQNYSRINEIIDVFKENNVYDKVHPYLGHVEDANDSYESSKCLSLERYSRFNLDFMLQNKQDITADYPKPMGAYCGANMTNAYVIDADGYIYKCWNDIGIKENRVGSLTDKNFEGNVALLNQYMLYDPTLDNRCIECKYLPICMGGCPSRRLENVESCVEQKYTLDQYLPECLRVILSKKSANGEEKSDIKE